jgi:hypothetical protein
LYRYGAGRFCDEHLDRAHVFWALPPACRGIVGSEGGGDGCDELGSSVGTTGTTGGYVWDWSATGRRRGEPKGPPANAFEAEEESDWETEEEEDLDTDEEDARRDAARAVADEGVGFTWERRYNIAYMAAAVPTSNKHGGGSSDDDDDGCGDDGNPVVVDPEAVSFLCRWIAAAAPPLEPEHARWGCTS